MSLKGRLTSHTDHSSGQNGLRIPRSPHLTDFRNCVGSGVSIHDITSNESRDFVSISLFRLEPSDRKDRTFGDSIFGEFTICISSGSHLDSTVLRGDGPLDETFSTVLLGVHELLSGESSDKSTTNLSIIISSDNSSADSVGFVVDFSTELVDLSSLDGSSNSHDDILSVTISEVSKSLRDLSRREGKENGRAEQIRVVSFGTDLGHSFFVFKIN